MLPGISHAIFLHVLLQWHNMVTHVVLNCLPCSVSHIHGRLMQRESNSHRRIVMADFSTRKAV